MPLSLNEIRARSLAFTQEYRNAASERADAQPFWRDFFNVFGINSRRVGAFERPVRDLLTTSGRGRIDYLWKGVVLVEHKSRGEDLDHAAGQARDYFPGLRDRELPKHIVVSDFARLRVYDLEGEAETALIPFAWIAEAKLVLTDDLMKRGAQIRAQRLQSEPQQTSE